MLKIPHRILESIPAGRRPATYDHLGNAGGFSGAEFWRWKARSAGGPSDWVLRRWPQEHPDRARLTSIHRILIECGAQLSFLPVPLPFTDGDTIAEADGHLWECTPWLPGKADFHAHPSLERAKNALEALAAFHLAAQKCAAAGPTHSAPCQTLVQRVEQLQGLTSGGFELLAQRVRTPIVAKSVDDAAEFYREVVNLAPGLLDDAQAVSQRVWETARRRIGFPVACQPVVRDIWHDHLLFEGDRVTGVIDFGGMRADNVSVDVARLLGSLAGTDDELWHCGLKAYDSLRPLSEPEVEILESLAETGAVLGPMNWLKWLYVEGREFENGNFVLARLRETGRNLRHLREKLGVRRTLIL